MSSPTDVWDGLLAGVDASAMCGRLSTEMRERRLPSVLWNPDAMVAGWERLEGLEQSLGATLMTSHDLDFETTRRLAPDAWYE